MNRMTVSRRRVISSIITYMGALQREFVTGLVTRPDYNAALEDLLHSALGDMQIIRQAGEYEADAHLFTIQQKDETIAHLVTFPFDTDIDTVAQQGIIKTVAGSGLNVLVTNFLEFRWYRTGSKVQAARLGKKVNPGGRPSLARIPGGAEKTAQLLRNIKA